MDLPRSCQCPDGHSSSTGAFPVALWGSSGRVGHVGNADEESGPGRA